MTDSTPVLIAAIESEPILYDRNRSDFKDIVKKRGVWRSVAAKVGLTAQEAERRWRHVRDGFSKYRRRSRHIASIGFKGQTVKEYKYARMLDFLTPFKPDPQSSSIWAGQGAQYEYSMLVNDVSLVDKSESFSENAVTVKSEPRAEPGPAFSEEAPTSSLQEESRASCSEPTEPETSQSTPTPMSVNDDLDLFMCAMAQSIRKLPLRQRAALKYQIHALVHKAEMEFYNDWSLS